MTIEQRLHDALHTEDRGRAPAPPGDVDALIGRGRRRAFVTRSASALAGVIVLAGAGVGVSRMAERPPTPVIGSEAPSTAPSPTVAPTTDPSPAPTGSETGRDQPSDGVDTSGPVTAADLGPALGLDTVLHRIDADGTRTDLWENIAFRIGAFAEDPTGQGVLVGIAGQNDPPSTTIGRVADGELTPIVEAAGDRSVHLLDSGRGPDGAPLLVYAVTTGPRDGTLASELVARDLETGEERALWGGESPDGFITHADLATDRIAFVHDGQEGFTTAHVVTLDGEELLDPVGRFGDAGPDGPTYAGIALAGEWLVIVEDHGMDPGRRVELVVRDLDGRSPAQRTPLPLAAGSGAQIHGVTARGDEAVVVTGRPGELRSFRVDLATGITSLVEDRGGYRLLD